MHISNVSIAKKQIVAFAMMLVVMGGTAGNSLHSLATVNRSLDEVSHNRMPLNRAVAEIRINAANLRAGQVQTAYAGEEGFDAPASEMIGYIDRINENIDLYTELSSLTEADDPYLKEGAALYDEFDREWERYQDLSFDFFEAARGGNRDAAITIFAGELKEAFVKFDRALEELSRLTGDRARFASDRADERYRRSRRLTQLNLIITVLFVALSVVYFNRYITYPIKALERASTKVANGALDVTIPVRGRDEIGRLARSFNDMTASLREAMDRTRRQAERLQSQNEDLERAMVQIGKAQEQLVTREKMATIGHLAAGLAHEINNPIGAVKSAMDVTARCVSRLEKIACDAGDARLELEKNLRALRDSSSISVEATSRIARLVSSLKNFIGLDRSAYHTADINEGLESAIVMIESEFGAGVRVRREFSDLPRIPCFFGQLNQAFFNVLKNAAEAIEEGGGIVARTRVDGGSILVEIRDDGRGIPQERIEGLFDFGFVRGGERVKMVTGLMTAYNVVQEHGGEIVVESEAGEGTTVRITLPIEGNVPRETGDKAAT